MKKRENEMMNKYEKDILRILSLESYNGQRTLSEISGYSLGIVNRSVRNLTENGYLDENNKITEKAKHIFKEHKPRIAVILAAGYGMRMVPINMETPKALIEVDGETLIERIIKQLHEAGIREIYVVVGFMKEQFEYLIDEYDIKLVINEKYSSKNNLHSLSLVADKISNTYIIPCDIWCRYNPFDKNELYSWYMVSDLVDNESWVRINRKMELVSVPETVGGNAMLGISYLDEEEALIVRKRIKEMSCNTRYDNSFWEEVLFEKDRMIVYAKVVHSSDIVEINTYEQLRDLDCESDQLKSGAIMTIVKALKVDQEEIHNITVLKKGMTNRSFLFNCKDKKYIMRIPGEGTEQLIDRKKEASVYQELKGKSICDDIVYINSNNGYKITEYLEEARVCDAKNVEDLKKCMIKLKEFHKQNLYVEYEFDIFEEINFYESLWKEKKSVYRDYSRVKEEIYSLKEYIDTHIEKRCLTHIDAVPDNFLIVKRGQDEEVRLIDWEYAGMQDPHVDIAMFCIYSLYDRKEIDRLIDIYFDGNCEKAIRIKIYCYIAVCGLLWSNWCEYKRILGIDFGEYSIRQYRYAKEYYRIVMEELSKEEEGEEGCIKSREQ